MMPDTSPTRAYPDTTLELRSTLADDGGITLAMMEAPVEAPGPDEVVVRIEAAPINPSDMGMLFAGADLTTATAVSDGTNPAVRLSLAPGVAAAQAARLGQAMPTGNEGAGVVVAAGSSDHAQALLGRVVGFLSGNAYAQYRRLNVAQCLAMPDGTTSAQAAAPFVNPLTAIGMVETMRAEGHTALVHTVGASNLGQMLNRLCLADGVGLVNIVRSSAQAELVRSQGGEHVCDSSSDTFSDDLRAALRSTGATIAFDAIGGGTLADTLLTAMEAVASESASAFSRYGSDTHKQVYLYGGLDRSPTTLNRRYGMSWGVGGWLLTPFLVKIGHERAEALRARVAAEITTTFASDYGMRISLAEAVDPNVVKRYGRAATGEKALVTPQA
ncbi:MAG: NADH oxidase [Acidimicrobiales bacterium]